MHWSFNIIIIAITCVVSVISFSNAGYINRLAFVPSIITKDHGRYRYWTYGLVHAGWGHLIINMFVLWSFGSVVEDAYEYMWNMAGKWVYVWLYVSALPISVISDGRRYKYNTSYISVGASGAVSAVVFASILLFPLQKLYIMFIPIGVPAAIFGMLYLFYSAYMGHKGGDNIAHHAHFWGAVYGFLFALLIKPRLIVAFFVQIFQVF
ncbi:MAG: rhomboid family intramembrane serine protease [Bacteroidales bacterium]|nr:rhomboid family intramembrane serine protease [Bacteroidales bacterium]